MPNQNKQRNYWMQKFVHIALQIVSKIQKNVGKDQEYDFANVTAQNSARPGCNFHHQLLNSTKLKEITCPSNPFGLIYR